MANYVPTTKYLLRKITGGSNRNEIDDGIGALADDIDARMAGYAQGTLAAIPGAGKSGRFYRATDTGQVFMDTGSAWIEIGVAPWAPGDLKATWLTAAPTGWLLCDGSAVSRTTYAALFAAIGTSAGTGDGGTTFNVPDARARALIMPDGSAARMAANDSRGLSGGSETHTLTAAEIPDLPVTGVNQGGTPPGNIGSGPGGIRGDASGGGGNYSMAVTTGGAFSFFLKAAGGGGAHSVLQPYLVVGAVLIKT